jgi:putative transposase
MRENRLRALDGYRTRLWSVGEASDPDPEPTAAPSSPSRLPNQSLGDGHHLRADVAGVAVPRRRDGSLLAQDCGLGRPSHHTPRALDVVLMAVRARRPRGTLIHSDQGTQYGSDAWRRFCRSHRLEPSMSRKGNCWDNAVAEAFFGSLKKELIKKQIYKSRDLATAAIATYIETFYNRSRWHSHLGGISPEQFEAAHKSRKQGVH